MLDEVSPEDEATTEIPGAWGWQSGLTGGHRDPLRRSRLLGRS
jgi:hypothetical protein